MTNTESITLDDDFLTSRLDQALSNSFPQYSRSQLQSFIKAGLVTVNGQVISKQRHPVQAGDLLCFTAEAQQQTEWAGEDIPLNIIYEDDQLLIVDKPAPMVAHPGAGVHSGTLVNALLHHCPDLQQLPRAGLIHRLDKETTGLLVIAKTLTAHTYLSDQMQKRHIKRFYQAVVQGSLVSGGTVDAAIGRHPTARTKMCVSQHGGRHAVTHYRILNRFRHHTHLQLQLETGRTHQIRVHMMHIRHPIVGDPTYSREKIPRHACETLKTTLQQFRRQALHAYELTLTHPVSGEEMTWTAPLPDDFQQLLCALQHNETTDEPR